MNLRDQRPIRWHYTLHNPAMSSPTFTVTSPSPSSTDSSASSNGVSQHSSNYFFGFLITFVGLLMIFIAFGIGSRRRFAARREARLNGPWESLRHFPNGKLEEKPPHLYEQPFVMGEDKLQGLMPLSVKLWREDKEGEEEGNPVTHGLQVLPPAIPARRSPGHIFHSLTAPSFNKNLPLPTQPDPKPPEETTIQVAVMIVMPSTTLIPRASSQLKRSDSKRLPEYQIGSISFPWPHHDSYPGS